MGTGVNSQIILTSTYWRFDFFSGIFLLLLTVPLNIVLVKQYGIIGSAWSNLAAYFIYNVVRIIFLWRKFRMQPFTIQTAWVLLHSVACYLVMYLLCRGLDGWAGIFVRSILFVLLFVFTAIYLKLSPDIEPVVNTIKKRLGIKR
jgi:hypothetical protein